tara:strand:- start:11410 stop:12135 length:726 start_codon:yes stop_codon:yes gene_type:complete
MNKIKNISCVVDEVRAQGFSIIPNFWDEKKCSDGRSEIDKIISKYPTAISKNSSDNRIFAIEHFSQIFRDEFINRNYVNEIMKSLYSSKTIYGTLLGQRVEGTPGNSGSGGSWHRDSLKKQFKAFLFISDVDDKSGPFQFFPKSNYYLNKFIACLSRGRRWNNLDYANENELTRAKIDISNQFSVTCQEGTLLVADTSTIHRGKPGLEKDRYSVTYYSFKHDIPDHINEIVNRNKNIASAF